MKGKENAGSYIFKIVTFIKNFQLPKDKIEKSSPRSFGNRMKVRMKDGETSFPIKQGFQNFPTGICQRKTTFRSYFSVDSDKLRIFPQRTPKPPANSWHYRARITNRFSATHDIPSCSAQILPPPCQWLLWRCSPPSELRESASRYTN